MTVTTKTNRPQKRAKYRGHQTFIESLKSDLYDIKAKLIKQFLLAFICGNQSCTALNSSVTTGRVLHLQAFLRSTTNNGAGLDTNAACRLYDLSAQGHRRICTLTQTSVDGRHADGNRLRVPRRVAVILPEFFCVRFLLNSPRSVHVLPRQ